MKTEQVDQHGIIHWHSLPLIAHVEGAGHIGFINRLPLPLRLNQSILMFFAKDGLMQCSQSAIPDSVGPIEALAQVYHAATGEGQASQHLGHSMRTSGQYVGLGIIFALRAVNIDDNIPRSEAIHLVETRAVTRPGVVTLHDGQLVTAQYRRGRYAVLPNSQSMDDSGQAFTDTHEALVRLADSKPKPPGRRLRDMYRDD